MNWLARIRERQARTRATLDRCDDMLSEAERLNRETFAKMRSLEARSQLAVVAAQIDRINEVRA